MVDRVLPSLVKASTDFVFGGSGFELSPLLKINRYWRVSGLLFGGLLPLHKFAKMKVSESINDHQRRSIKSTTTVQQFNRS